MRPFALLGLVVVSALTVGCRTSNGPVARASYDPEKAAQTALIECDRDKDGFLSGAELDACPGIKSAAARIDTNKDKKLSRDELKARFATYGESSAAACGVTCRVTLGGSPVAGAEVTFTPEPCLGDSLQSATGTTDDSGAVSPVRADGVPGLSPGMYRVKVTGPGVPADYGSRPLLGHEVTADGRGAGATVEFRLATKPR